MFCSQKGKSSWPSSSISSSITPIPLLFPHNSTALSISQNLIQESFLIYRALFWEESTGVYHIKEGTKKFAHTTFSICGSSYSSPQNCFMSDNLCMFSKFKSFINSSQFPEAYVFKTHFKRSWFKGRPKRIWLFYKFPLDEREYLRHMVPCILLTDKQTIEHSRQQQIPVAECIVTNVASDFQRAIAEWSPPQNTKMYPVA